MFVMQFLRIRMVADAERVQVQKFFLTSPVTINAVNTTPTWRLCYGISTHAQ
jgi:hypothetical protein